MSTTSERIGGWALWTITALAALGMGSAGISKLFTTGEWDRLFQSWGYPVWFMILIGCIELLGAAALFIRRAAPAAALVLAAVMLGAAATLIMHPGSHFFRGRQAPMTLTTPVVWFVLLTVIGIVRWRQSASSHRAAVSL
jgi:uncharacterized membrane protein YphA (DoxX/SURF4 family)